MKLKSISALFFLFSSLLLVKAQSTSTWSRGGIILSSEGYIATSNYILKDGYHFEVDVFSNGIKKTYVGSVVKSDPINDLTIIKIDDPLFKTIGLVPFSLKVKDIKEGEKVFVMAYPKVESKDEGLKLTQGIISSKSGYLNDVINYQISCIMQPADAGAPLFDNYGNVIGIISSNTKSGQSTGFAVKASCLNNLLETIPKMPLMPSKTSIAGLSMDDKVKALSKFIVMVRLSNKVIADTSKDEKILVGQTYGGGIVFYVDGTGKHGLIAATDNGEGKRAQWGCYETPIDETSLAVGSGKDNTAAIVNSCKGPGSAGIAAKICSELVLNGYNDWFLPSKNELNLLYIQKELVGYEHGYYWSSSEFDSHFAWFQHFDFGFQDYLNKDFSYYYRPIRAF